MNRIVLDFLTPISIITLSFPLVLIAFNLNRQPKAFIWLAIACAFSIACDVGGLLLIFAGYNPNYAASAYWLLGTMPLSFFFYYAINWEGLKASLSVINVLYFLFGLLNFLYIQTIAVNSYSNILHTLIVILLCIIYYYKLIKELPSVQLQRFPLFWVVSAFFFSYAGKLAIYTVTHYLIHFVKDNMVLVWSFHNFLTIIANLLIGYGAWLNHKQLRSTSLSL